MSVASVVDLCVGERPFELRTIDPCVGLYGLIERYSVRLNHRVTRVASQERLQADR